MESSGLRFILIGLILLCPVLAAINAMYHSRQLKDYVRHVGRINDMADLARFQKLVARQMYAALAQSLLMTAPLALYFLGIFIDQLWLPDAVFVIVPGFIVIVLGYVMKKLENQVCRIPAANQDLNDQRLAVINIWRTRPLPNW